VQWLARISVKRPVFAAVLILTLCVAGIYSFFQLGIDQYPDIDVPTITVTTTLPGASPDEMDTTVTEEIEKQVNTVSSIDSISSVSSQGISVVTITFLLDKSTDVAFSDVQSKVNLALPNLPPNINQPTVQKLSTDSGAIVSFALSGKGQKIRDITEYADKTLRPQLESVPGVGQANIIGGQLRQMNVILNPDRLRAFNLSPIDVKNALQSQNVEVPGGSLENGDRRVSVRTMSRFNSAKELAQMVVAQQDGQPIFLWEVARVEDGAEEATSIARLDGQNTVEVDIQKQSGTNSIAVIQALKAKLAEVIKTLPKGYQVQVTRDQSVFILASVDTVEEHLMLGSVLAALVVLVFLWDWRSTIIAALAIPASIIATFALIYAKGFTLNTVTLLALTLAVGIVIDDAILVLENIVRFLKEKNQSPRKAALEATQEIGLAVLATTLSLVAIFLPIAFMSGILGRFLTSFGLTMAFAILISLLVAFTLTPMLSSRWLQGNDNSEKAEDEPGYVPPRSSVEHQNSTPTDAPHFADHSRKDPEQKEDKKGTYYKIETAYWHLLRWSLRHRWMVVTACIVLFISIVPLVLRVNKGFLPNDDQSQFIATVRAPEGTTLQATGNLLERMATDIRKFADVKFTVVTVGSDPETTANLGSILVQMKEIKDRKDDETQFTLMKRVREEIVPMYPKDLRVIVSSPSLIGGGAAQSDIQYIVSGPDIQMLGEISDKMMPQIKKLKGVTDADTSATNGDPELRVNLLRKQASDLGVSASDIATTAQIVVAGLHVTDYSQNGHRYDVNLRAAPRFRKDAADLSLFTAPSTKEGLKAVPLNQVADFSVDTAPATINRYARSRQVTFSVNIGKGESQSDVQDKISEMFAGLHLGSQYSGQFGGFSKEQGKAFASFGIALVLSFIFVYLILAAQFESWLHPITILFSLPLSVPFALISMIVMGVSINIFSMLGILVLFGVVKKNSILQVDHSNQLRARGLEREEAVLEASRDRLRPILMTTCAFVAGMLPLALSKGVGADTNHSAGDVIIGGQTLSLLLSLVATPVIYTLMDDLSTSIGRLKERLSHLLIRQPAARKTASDLK
jgi:HAE1 family hydrophobic/amphiphilic exporter-1